MTPPDDLLGVFHGVHLYSFGGHHLCRLDRQIQEGVGRTLTRYRDQADIRSQQHALLRGKTDLRSLLHDGEQCRLVTENCEARRKVWRAPAIGWPCRGDVYLAGCTLAGGVSKAL